MPKGRTPWSWRTLPPQQNPFSVDPQECLTPWQNFGSNNATGSKPNFTLGQMECNDRRPLRECREEMNTQRPTLRPGGDATWGDMMFLVDATLTTVRKVLTRLGAVDHTGVPRAQRPPIGDTGGSA